MSHKDPEELWTRQLRHHLAEIVEIPDGPHADIKYLIMRCDETLRMTGSDEDRHASVKQLAREIHSFDAEFPELLPPEVLRGP